jgi:hypothetical protein
VGHIGRDEARVACVHNFAAALAADRPVEVHGPDEISGLTEKVSFVYDNQRIHGVVVGHLNEFFDELWLEG